MIARVVLHVPFWYSVDSVDWKDFLYFCCDCDVISMLTEAHSLLLTIIDATDS